MQDTAAQKHKGTEAQQARYRGTEIQRNIGHRSIPHTFCESRLRHRESTGAQGGKETQRNRGAHRTKAQKQCIPRARFFWDTRLRHRQGTGATRHRGTEALTEQEGTETKYPTHALFVGYSLAPRGRHRGKTTQRNRCAYRTKSQASVALPLRYTISRKLALEL